MNSVVGVKRHSERVLILKMVLDDGLIMFLWFMLLTQENWRRKN